MENRCWGNRGLAILFLGFAFQLFFLTECSVKTPARKILSKTTGKDSLSAYRVKLYVHDQQVMMDNGILKVTLSNPDGLVTAIQFNGVHNLLDTQNEENNRGYWDINWNMPGYPDNYDRLVGTKFRVIMENEDQVELSFTTTWKPSTDDSALPLNVDKRFIMLSNCSGFYAYGIFEREEGWPGAVVNQARIAFKLQKNLFGYMALSDDRQRVMPSPEDREMGQPLAYKEAVLLKSPTNSDLEGEVDDKYQYSIENKDNRVHGWISSDPPVGFWMITPSNEFRTAGPLKQDLTSHVGPITLSMFVSTHYAGEVVGMRFQDGEPWKKVFGPVLVYLNSVSAGDIPLNLWEDAKQQMSIEVESWPYDFPHSEDFHSSNQRGTVRGQLVVHDRYISAENSSAKHAYVGLAAPGEIGSWQTENKAYQFWTESDNKGYFSIEHVRAGDYNLHASVPGVIGDYKLDVNVTITPGCEIELGSLVYEPPRDGPTLWEIGVPDRTAKEFYVPDPDPMLINPLYINHTDKFRQYGLWERYSDLYKDGDLVYIVGVDDYRKDWFFAHVTRNLGNKTYVATTWQILFELDIVKQNSIYVLRLALASATDSELQVRLNDEFANPALFSTGRIGKDNAIARHGIHGLYRLYSIEIPSSQLNDGSNIIFLRQSRGQSPFQGVMYDYIRLEGPSDSNSFDKH